MIISDIENSPISLRGRAGTYPFENLGPNQKLTIDVVGDKKEHRTKVSTSLYNFKRNNKLTWKTAVKLNGDSIIVYRLS